MSQDHDPEPLDATRQFAPIDPYNIGPDTAGAPLPDYDDGMSGAGDARGGVGAGGVGGAAGQPHGLKQRLGRLGAPRLAALGTGLVILVGGAAWGTSAALASSHSSSTADAQNQAQDQGPGQGQVPAGPDGTTGAGKKGKNAAKAAARVKITKLEAGSFTGTEGKGRTVTVVYGDDTKFGTKARPLSADQLQVGMTVTVAGTRAGDKITALVIAETPKKADAATGGGEPATSGSSPGSDASSSPGSEQSSSLSG